MKPVESNFTSHRFISETKPGHALIYRILKMDSSVFVYIGNKDDQAFGGLGLGLITNQHGSEAVSTSIVESSDSRDLAQKLSKRLKKPVFVSCNENLDQILKPLIERRLIEEMTTHPELF